MSILDEVYGAGKEDETGKPGLLWKLGNLSPAVALWRLSEPARKMAGAAYDVGSADKSAGLLEGMIPFTPDFIGESETLTVDGKQVTIPGLDARLRAIAEEKAGKVDDDLRAVVQRQLDKGAVWPVQEGQPWYSVDPDLVPDAINTWAASVGDQAATLVQQLLGGAIGATAAFATTKSPIAAKIGKHVGGAIPNIANETAGYMHDAEFWGINDRKIMEENARYYGMASGLIEYSQNAVELAATKGVMKVGAKELMKRNLVVQGLKELGIAGAEGLTEVSQDGLSRFFLRRAAEQMKAQDPNFDTPEIPDTFSGWKRTFTLAAGTSAIMRGGGHAASRTMQGVHETFQQDYAAEVGENPLGVEPQAPAPAQGAQPRVMPQADVEGVDNEQLRTEGEAAMTAQEQADLEQIEAEPEATQEAVQTETPVEDRAVPAGVQEGTVKPKLFIGGVLQESKQNWAEALNKARRKEGLPPTREAREMQEAAGELGDDVSTRDIGPHKEGPFPTKRTEIELTVDEARDLEQQLVEKLDDWLADGEWMGYELAEMKDLWGDISALRKALGLPVGKMPFKVIQSGKTLIAAVPNTTERIYTSIEGTNKRVLADMSPADLVTEGEALKAAMKKAAKAAKHAFSVGGKEAVAKLRQHIKELKRKARAIAMAKEARKRMVRVLTKDAPDSLDPAYRKAVQAIADGVDPVGRTAETQKWIDKAKSDYDHNPELFGRTRPAADKTLLKRHGQVPVNRMSTRQLEALVDERQRIEEEGRGVAEREARQRATRQAGFVQDGISALQSVRQRGRLDPGQETDNATWFQRMLDRVRGLKGDVGFGGYRIDRMFEYLDGFKRGFFTHMWENAKASLHTSRERRSIRVRELVQAAKDRGIDGAKWMIQTMPFRKSDGTIHNMTPWQLLGVYVQSRNESGREHLVHGNKFSPRDLAEIARMVEADEGMSAMHSWIVERQQGQWKALTERLRAEGIDPTQFVTVEEYLPLLIADRDMIEQDDLLQKFVGKFVPQELMPKGFLKERQEGARQPIETDALMLYMHSVDQVEHVMAMLPALNRMSKMLQNQKFRKTLDGKTYGKGSEIMTQWLMDIGRDRVVREQMWYDKMVGYMQRNAVLYAIGWNIPSVLKQIPALAVGFAEDSNMARFLVGNMVSLSSQEKFNEFRSEARKRSNVLRHRNIEPELRAMWNKPHLQAMMRKQFGYGGVELDQAATSWMRNIDDWLTTLAWKCRYDAVMDAGMDEQTAIRLADQTVQKTQQMASPEDLPHLFRGGTIASILNLFQNQGNQELNYWVHDIYGKATHGKLTKGQVAWRVMMSVVLPIAVYNVVSHGGGQSDDEEEQVPFWARMFTYAAGNLPVVGNAANAVVSTVYPNAGGFGSGSDLWEMPMEGVKQIAAGVSRGDVGSVLKGTAKVAGGALPTKGVINSQAVRTIEAAYGLSAGEVEDKRRLVWSKSMLKGTEGGGL